jgi:hypothetical protein
MKGFSIAIASKDSLIRSPDEQEKKKERKKEMLVKNRRRNPEKI